MPLVQFHLRPSAARRAAALGVAVAALAAVAPTTARAQGPARIPDCTEAVAMTSLSSYVDCIGAIDIVPPVQGAGLLPLLDLAFGEYGTWSFLGKSEDFMTNLFGNDPTGRTGTLLFDTPLTGVWGIGLKSGTGSSVYVYNFSTPTPSLVYSTAGTSVNVNDLPQGLSHAELFRPGPGMTVVPEPGTYALLATGLLMLAGVARRRQRA